MVQNCRGGIASGVAIVTPLISAMNQNLPQAQDRLEHEA
jgi:hypothetical protein